MSSATSKKHKRSGSVIVHSASAAGPSHRRRPMVQAHGKFQVKVKRAKERKNFDLSNPLTFFDVPASAVVTLLNAYTAGTTANNTLGRRVVNKSVHVRLTACWDTTGAAANAVFYATTCRVLVIYDRQNSTGTPGIAQILQDTAQLGSAVMNLQYSDRFSIIMDEKFVLGPAANGATAGVVNVLGDAASYTVDRYVKVGLPTVAAGASFTGGVAGIAEGAIFLVAFCDQAHAASSGVKIVSMATRIRFVDD